jgi:hypothetical protein
MKGSLKLLHSSFLALFLGIALSLFRDLSVLYYVNFEGHYCYPFLTIGTILTGLVFPLCLVASIALLMTDKKHISNQ